MRHFYRRNTNRLVAGFSSVACQAPISNVEIKNISSADFTQWIVVKTVK